MEPINPSLVSKGGGPLQLLRFEPLVFEQAVHRWASTSFPLPSLLPSGCLASLQNVTYTIEGRLSHGELQQNVIK